MSKQENLLIILDQAALVAELEATKGNDFTVSSLRQVNGEFISDSNQLNTANLTKLLTKVDSDLPYHLVLPDQFFFDQIFAVPTVNDEEIKEYLNEKILPKQPISFDTHQILTSFLLQIKETCRIQISAAPLELLGSIGNAIAASGAQITDVLPISWLTKAIISLEPALSLVEADDKFYLAQHYIGIAKTATFTQEQVDDLIEEIKNWKEEEPNLQTVYLLTSVTTETQLKRGLKGIIPLQQMTDDEDENQDEMNPEIKALIENGAASLQMVETAIPLYEPMTDDSQVGAATIIAETTSITIEEEPEIEVEDEEVADAVEEAVAPPAPPKNPPTIPDEVEIEEELAEELDLAGGSVSQAVNKAAQQAEIEEEMNLSPEEIAEEDLTLAEVARPKKKASPSVMKIEETPIIRRGANSEPEYEEEEEYEEIPRSTRTHSRSAAAAQRASAKPARKEDGIGKKILIFITIFLITVAVGVLISYAVLRMLGTDPLKKTPTPTPTPVTTPEPTPEPTPTPEPEPTFSEEDRAGKNVLIVNATGVAGLAGNTKTTLEAAGYKGVATGNAQGTDYEEGVDFILIDETDAGFTKDLETSSKLSLTVDTQGKKTEDPDGKYDAVIVLNKK